MNNTVLLRVNGQEWGGWTSVRIAAGIERIARDFTVEITRSWPGDTDQANHSNRIKNGDLVEVLIGADKVLTGYIEATPVRYDARSISVGISGRSKTADLIDCSATPSQYSGRSLAQVAAELAKPFSITVVDAGGASGALQGVQADQGEKVMDVLNKMLGLQQALAYDNAQGNLVIGGIGSQQAHTALVLGENILSCDTEKSIRDRFSDYQVSGQRRGNDDDFGEATTTAIRSKTIDGGLKRYRPMIIRQTGNATTATCSARAEFEVTYTVQGWRQGDGSLWLPNLQVIVFDPILGFNNRQMVIAEVTYQQDENGTVTEIRVGPPDAYLPEPAKPGKLKKKTTEEDDF